MTKRASLPGADELFKSTTKTADPGEEMAERSVADLSTKRQVEAISAPTITATPIPASIRAPLNSATSTEPEGRPRHEEKVTFYCTVEDIIRLDRAKLTLRADHRIAADRGRIVRQALTEILEDFEARGASSALVKALRDHS